MADIISFPLDRLRSDPRSAPTDPASAIPNPAPSTTGRLLTPSTDDSVALAIAICATRPPAPLSALPDTAWVIGTALRWINRRGKSRKAVPKLVLGLLDRHVAAGDPAAEMFDRWLDGHALPESTARDVELHAGLTSEADAVGDAGGGE
ncbi:hypothetical protein IHQ71_29835 (plasmid) [Rhizobium sp. TH2]|uniref:hypothetical protein n=1 Tax=Rhizobium sp. TH2 TaxID=2775403 RepID=UPI002158254B|nr:hypothetical protein [Rhizobium sp. TH2]UVC12235.1 hypothetical protein IHQ71_29835 [Rhizobium sp. TH2]